MDDNQMQRLFIAIPAGNEIPEVSGKLTCLNQNLKTTRWVVPHNLHLTAYFIGETLQTNIPSILSTMESVLQQTPDFDLVFDALTLEGGRTGHPSMVWARFQKHPAYRQMYMHFFEMLASISEKHSKFSDPVPHITLARIRSGPPPALTVPVTCTIKFHGFELWRSIRTESGVQYVAVGKKYRD